MSWQREVDGIEARKRLAEELGGSEAIAKQHERGRLTVRERISALLDEGSFREQGPIAGHSEVDENGSLLSFSPGNYVLGTGKINDRRCVIGGEDFTQRGGSPTPAGLRKSVYAEELACRYKIPLVRMLEGGGGSVTGASGKALSMGDPVYAAPRFASIARVLSTAPVVSAAMGAVAGFPAARLAASHLAIMTRHGSQVMIAGPAVVERALGQHKSKEELGGAGIHERSGLVDLVCEDEYEVFERIAQFLSYLPSNVWELPPRWATEPTPTNASEELLHIIPRDRRKTYDVRRLLSLIVDGGEFFEMTRGYGRSQITALARLGGRPLGLLANDTCYFAGAMDAAGAQKVRRFVDFCDTFHLPVVSFVDEPGFMIGTEAEAAATIRHGTSTICAVMQSSVPWASVIIRKAYGVAAAAHFGPEALVLSWPSAETGALPVEGGVAVAFRREIAAADDPDARRKELEESFTKGRSAFARAEAFGVHDLIDPRATREMLCDWLQCCEPLLNQQVGPKKYSLRP